MKKILSVVLCLSLMLGCACMLTACGGNAGVTQVGTWEYAELTYRVIEQGKLNTGNFNNITLFSDNTFVLTVEMNTYYSSDGGETYNPVADNYYVVHGTYEVTDENAELGEKTIKIASITRVQTNEFDTETGTDAQKAAMGTCETIGTEIILDAALKMSAPVSVMGILSIERAE